MTTGNRQAHLEAKIDTLKQELLTLGDLRPGTLSEQYNVCGKAGCACKADPPRKHGPYYQVSFTWQGRSHTQFVRRENLAATRQQLRTYERLRALVDAWVAAGLVVSRLLWKREKAHSSGEMYTTHGPSSRTASGGMRHGQG